MILFGGTYLVFWHTHYICMCIYIIYIYLFIYLFIYMMYQVVWATIMENECFMITIYTYTYMYICVCVCACVCVCVCVCVSVSVSVPVCLKKTYIFLLRNLTYMLLAINYFRITLYLRCFRGFWIHLYFMNSRNKNLDLIANCCSYDSTLIWKLLSFR